jgi:hypothetical protein
MTKKTQKKTAKSAVKKTGAVAKCWELFSQHPKLARKDQVAAAVAKGLNPSTAATQYQRWMHRGDK